MWGCASCPAHLKLSIYLEIFSASNITLNFTFAANKGSNIVMLYCQSQSLHQLKIFTRYPVASVNLRPISRIMFFVSSFYAPAVSLASAAFAAEPTCTALSTTCVNAKIYTQVQSYHRGFPCANTVMSSGFLPSSPERPDVPSKHRTLDV